MNSTNSFCACAYSKPVKLKTIHVLPVAKVCLSSSHDSSLVMDYYQDSFLHHPEETKYNAFKIANRSMLVSLTIYYWQARITIICYSSQTSMFKNSVTFAG